MVLRVRVRARVCTRTYAHTHTHSNVRNLLCHAGLPPPPGFRVATDFLYLLIKDADRLFPLPSPRSPPALMILHIFTYSIIRQ